MTNIALFNMVEQQIRPWNVRSARLLEAIGRLDRASFVPPEKRALAYFDTAIKLDATTSMLAPKIAARLIQALDIQADDRTLLIGAGSGYVASLCAMMGKEVVCQDNDQAALDRAAENARAAGIENISFVRVEEGEVDPAAQKYDAILIRQPVVEKPAGYLKALAENGRCAALVGDDGILQLMRYSLEGGDLRQESLIDVLASFDRHAGNREFVF